MKKFYPDSLLPDELVIRIREDSARAETMGMLTENQLSLIHQQKWFGLFVPTEWGGLESGLPDAIRLEENIAYADGSVGWVVTLCAGAGSFVGYMNETLRNEVFRNGLPCIAGSGQPGGTARKSINGFIINGTWPYASGSQHADWLTVNCRMESSAELASFIFRREEAEIIPAWNYFGLKASGGDSFSVSNLFVPSFRKFIIDDQKVVIDRPLYRFPFTPFAVSTIAANLSGMAICFLEHAHEIISKKKINRKNLDTSGGKGILLLEISLNDLNAIRRRFYEILDLCWVESVSGKKITENLLFSLTKISRQLARLSRSIANELYPYCGMSGARENSELNRIWKNINMAGMHSLILE